VVVTVALLGVMPGRPSGAEASPVSFDFDGGELTFQASTGSPVVLEYPAGGTLDGSWDPSSGAFDGTLDGAGFASIPQPFDMVLKVKLFAEEHAEGPIALSGTIPADGSPGELQAEIWLSLEIRQPDDWPFAITRYGPLQLSFDAELDTSTGALVLQESGILGPPIDGCAGSGCAYEFKDLATEWGLPASLTIPDATPWTWNNPGNDDNVFDLEFSGGPVWAFTDVPPDHPFVTEIVWMSESGISTGYDDGSFRPTVAVSRQAMASFLHRMAGEPATTLSEPFFADVPASHPFYDAIQWMAESGLSLGVPQGAGKPLYKPADVVSRQAMAAFLHRYAEGGPSTLGEPFFSDVPMSHGFYDDIQWMAETELSLGTPNPPGKPLYKPTVAVSRQAMAAFLYRFDQLPA